MRASPPGSKKSSQRSPCPIAGTLDVLGDRWTLLVVRDLVRGAERFKEFAAAPEGIPTNILTDRLTRLQEHGVVQQVAATDGSRHAAYRLTEKGRALLPVLAAVRDWGLTWVKGSKVMPARRA